MKMKSCVHYLKQISYENTYIYLKKGKTRIIRRRNLIIYLNPFV